MRDILPSSQCLEGDLEKIPARALMRERLEFLAPLHVLQIHLIVRPVHRATRFVDPSRRRLPRRHSFIHSIHSFISAEDGAVDFVYWFLHIIGY